MHLSAFLRPSNYDPRSYPRVASNAAWEVRGRLHRPAARRDFPELVPETLSPCRAELAAAYRSYVGEVSTPEYAVSLDLAAFLLALCRSRRPRRLLDLGSGFSSYVFRRHQASARPRPEVWSADDDPGWLAATRRHLERRGVGTVRFVAVEELPRGSADRFDLVLHDLNSIESRERVRALPLALGLLAPGGVLVVDDLDGYPYRRRVRTAVRTAGLRLVSLRSAILDDRWSYPGAVIREPTARLARSPNVANVPASSDARR